MPPTHEWYLATTSSYMLNDHTTRSTDSVHTAHTTRRARFHFFAKRTVQKDCILHGSGLQELFTSDGYMGNGEQFS